MPEFTISKTVRTNGHVVEYCNDVCVDKFDHGWHRSAIVDGQRYRVSLAPHGPLRRIAYSKRRGHWWYGTVRDSNAQTVWSGRVTKGTGVLSLLRHARLLT